MTRWLKYLARGFLQFDIMYKIKKVKTKIKNERNDMTRIVKS